MSAELKTACSIKYINIKMKKKLKNNSDIIYIIKDAGEVCVKILLFLLCCENLEKIDFEFMKNTVKPEAEDDDEILKAVCFWKDKNILDYEITSAPNVRGANMDNIINIILNISRDINIMHESESADSGEFAGGLGIYDEKYIIGRKNKPEKPQIPPEEKLRQTPEEKTEILIESVEPEEIEEIENFELVELIEDVEEIEEIQEIAPIEIIDEFKETEISEITEEVEQSKKINEQNSNRENHNINRTPRVSSQSVSSEELCDSLETNGGFRNLIHETQIKMKTIFNTADLGIIYNLYETNGMEDKLILKLAEICAEEDKNNIRYLEKVALGNAAGGILNLEQYEEKMQEMYKLIEFEDKIKKLFNARDKKFTNKEKNLIKKWAKEFDFSDDVLSEGYKRCMKQIEKLSLDYINGIYTNWHDKGFKTLDDINGEYGANPDILNSGANKRNTGFNVDQFFEKAVKKSMRI